LQPSCAEAYSALGLALHQKGALKEAFAAYGTALRLRPAPRAVAGQPALGPTLEVLSPRWGILLMIATEVPDGDKAPPCNLVVARAHGVMKKYRRLREGDLVAAGQLLARLDYRGALAALAIAERKAAAARAALAVSREARDEAERGYRRAQRLRRKNE